jgi:FkbM family methyltransferase
MDECYLRGMKFLLKGKPVVIDIGANAGFFSLFALSRLPGAKVCSYEPVHLNYGINAACFQKAVAGKSGTITLSWDSSDEFTTSATVFEGEGKNLTTITVPSVSLSDIFLENNLDRCDFLRMDCEGAEYDIIYNCLPAVMARIHNMAMEIHGGQEAGQNIDSLEAYLRELGFSTRRRPVGMLYAWRG